MPWFDHRISRDPAKFDYAGTSYFIAATTVKRVKTRQVRYVVIHITGGPAMTEQGAINQFLSGPSSAHYIVNRQGTIVQMVPESDIANHVKFLGSSENSESIGIEHVNPWNSANQTRPTNAQYQASATLVHDICRRHNIPMVHSANVPRSAGIKGHIEVDPNSNHVTCPNPAWNWVYYMTLVRSSRSSFRELIFDLSR